MPDFIDDWKRRHEEALRERAAVLTPSTMHTQPPHDDGISMGADMTHCECCVTLEEKVTRLREAYGRVCVELARARGEIADLKAEIEAEGKVAS